MDGWIYIVEEDLQTHAEYNDIWISSSFNDSQRKHFDKKVIR